MIKALDFSSKNQDQFLAELLDFIRIPSVSTEPKHRQDVQKAAEWLANRMQSAGLENVQIFDTIGKPLVYGDWLGAGPEIPTLLVYGHYDVQPAEPLELWDSPPYAPEIRGDFVYGRGVSDDKGQLYIHIKAVESYLKTYGELPVNIKFLVEGEEESGGAGLAAFIPQQKELLKADIALVSDTAMLNDEQPAIVYGLRGMLYTFLDIQGPARDLHSGCFGGGINNPLNALSRIIAKLQDEDGRVLIPGFYDRVRDLSKEEKAILAKIPLNKDKWLKGTGAPEIWGDPGYSLVERISARPTLDVHGIIGGYTGIGRKTVLPSKAHAKISMRLVPDQDPEEIFRLYKEYIQEITPSTVKVDVFKAGGSVPSITDYHIPAMKAASEAYKEVFGKAPVLVREGGSIPVVAAFQSVLGLETVLMGFGLPDDRIHAPNERFYLPNFYCGIETSIRFMYRYGSK